jgi:hypothetical protein
MELTQKMLNNLFTLDYKTGKLYNKTNRGRAKIGNEAGGLNIASNRWQIWINNKLRSRSRIVFLMAYGYLPEQIDHIDRIRWNDAPSNLRPATASQNMVNRGPYSKKGLPIGVRKAGSRYSARILKNGKYQHLGMYNTQAEAARVVQTARIKLHGEFAICSE